MKRIIIEKHFGKNGNEIKLSNNTASTKITIDSLKCMLDPNYNEPLKK